MAQTEPLIVSTANYNKFTEMQSKALNAAIQKGSRCILNDVTGKKRRRLLPAQKTRYKSTLLWLFAQRNDWKVGRKKFKSSRNDTTQSSTKMTSTS
jgi:hypothetical protein